MSMSTDSTRQLLRHTVATVAYRAGKALRGSPNHFSSFHIGDKTRTPAQILAHMGDLFDWALSIAQGKPAWHDSTPLPWNAEIARFFAALKKFDDHLASAQPLHGSAEGLSITSARSPCSAASAAPPSWAKTISERTSPLAASAPNNPLPSANLNDPVILNEELLVPF